MATRPMAPTPAAAASSVMGMGRLAPRGEFSCNVPDGLDQLLGHPADGGQNFAQGEPRQDAASLLDAVFAFAGGALFQGVIDLVTDSTGLLDSLTHGKDQARDGHFRPLLKMQAVGRMVANPVAAAGFA